MSNEDLEHESVLENIKESLKYKDAKSLKMFILERKLSDESIFYEVAIYKKNDCCNNYCYLRSTLFFFFSK
jgi:hypothetical protein